MQKAPEILADRYVSNPEMEAALEMPIGTTLHGIEYVDEARIRIKVGIYASMGQLQSTKTIATIQFLELAEERRSDKIGGPNRKKRPTFLYALLEGERLKNVLGEARGAEIRKAYKNTSQPGEIKNPFRLEDNFMQALALTIGAIMQITSNTAHVIKTNFGEIRRKVMKLLGEPSARISELPPGNSFLGSAEENTVDAEETIYN